MEWVECVDKPDKNPHTATNDGLKYKNTHTSKEKKTRGRMNQMLHEC